MMTNIIAILKTIGMYLGFVAVVTIGVLHRVTPTQQERQLQKAIQAREDSLKQDSVEMIKTLGKWLVADIMATEYSNSLKFNIDIVDSLVIRITADSAENARLSDLVGYEKFLRKCEDEAVENASKMKSDLFKDKFFTRANELMDKADSVKHLINTFNRDTSSIFYLIPVIIVDLDSLSFRYSEVILTSKEVTRGGGYTYYAR